MIQSSGPPINISRRLEHQRLTQQPLSLFLSSSGLGRCDRKNYIFHVRCFAHIRYLSGTTRPYRQLANPRLSWGRLDLGSIIIATFHALSLSCNVSPVATSPTVMKRTTTSYEYSSELTDEFELARSRTLRVVSPCGNDKLRTSTCTLGTCRNSIRFPYILQRRT